MLFLLQKEVEVWRRPKNFNKALGEAQHLIENADMNKVLILIFIVGINSYMFFSLIIFTSMTFLT